MAIDIYFRSFIAWIDPQIFVPRQVMDIPGSVPFPGGLLLAALLLVNLLAAHSLRFSFSRKRIGIVLLHAGLILLIAGEFVTAWYAEEGLMSIDVGASSRYVEDLQSVEMVVVDPSDEKVDQVVSIPAALLRQAARSGKAITDPALPFAIEVGMWQANSRLMRARGQTAADQGIGLEAFPEALPLVRGVDGAQVDAPAAYVTLTREGRPLGTWLLWVNLIDNQPVLINAIILHARWGGIIRERGMMVLAVAGNIVTAWSWFGTNMLGIGLHAYGFMDSAVFWLMAFVISQLVLISIGLIPLPGWRSGPGSMRSPASTI